LRRPAVANKLWLDAAAVEKAIKIREPRLSSAHSLLHAVRSLIPAMSRGRGRRYLILLDDGSCEPPDAGALREIVGAISALIPAASFCRPQNEDSSPELLTGLYAYLTASYHVRYEAIGSAT
jgi:hypothetical protein